MRVFIITLLAVTLTAFQLGCSADSNTNVNSVAEQPVATPGEAETYTDAKLALLDGTKLIETNEVEKAISLLNKAIELDPELAEAYFRLGIAQSLIEYRDIAKVDSEGQETPLPGETPKPGAKKEEAKLDSVKSFEKAVESYKKWIKTNSKDDAAFFNMGLALNKLNNDVDAEKAFEKAVDLKPEDALYQTEYGNSLIKLAKYHEAIKALKKALEIDAENIQAEELLERAEAGRKRTDFVQTKKEDKPKGESKPKDEDSVDGKEGDTKDGKDNKDKKDDKTPPKPPPPPPAKPKPTSTVKKK